MDGSGPEGGRVGIDRVGVDRADRGCAAIGRATIGRVGTACVPVADAARVPVAGFGRACDAGDPAAGGTVSYALYHDLVQAIVSALEARDPHTAEHSLRVADMVERTCRLMGMPPEQAGVVHMAAHLHDIGKIGIPDCVLLKRARLTPEEHAILRDHARIGAQIVGSVPGLAAVAEVVRSHHERWDGSGYPDGLAGERIPYGARIVAVCDSIDAMLGKRLSKKPLTQRECVQEIFANTGSMYDPAVARFVLSNWDDIVGPVDFRDSGDFESGCQACYRSLCCEVPQLSSLARGA